METPGDGAQSVFAEDGVNLSALTQYNYDIAGNVVSVSDPNRHLTQYNFNYDGSNRYAFATQATNALGQTASAAYDYNIAKPTSTVDLNG
jgi:YD repeat-containing protein